MKIDCPNSNKGEERDQKKVFKKKKTYIVWELNNKYTTSLNDSDE